MPQIKSRYKPSLPFKSGFISTVYSGLIRYIKYPQKRERIKLSDGDFLDLDWSYASRASNSLVIILHGMEGHGQRPYVSGIARHLNTQHMDAICVNFRGCSGQINTQFFSFHSGQTEDLKDIITHVISNHNYDSIFLNGISLGGNIVLKYLGETSDVPNQIKAGMAVSVPVDLAGSSKALHSFKNCFFHIYFMIALKLKLKQKHRQFPTKISRLSLWRIWTLRSLDEIYTSRANGFKDAAHYYNKSNSLQYLPAITTPVLILNALNDTFLTETCYPNAIAEDNPFIYLETPKHGGHVGFILPGGVYYNELRAAEFFLKFK
ncbi:MAG: YheT family hydrolase [Flavobacteriaceae bacterium]